MKIKKISDGILNFAPPSDEPLFTVYWRGRKDKNCSGSWHTPGVMDGGFCAGYNVENGVCTVSYGKDNFWGSETIERKSFNVEKCKEYEVYIEDGHIVVPGVELEVKWDSEIAEKVRIQRAKEEAEYRKAHPEDCVDLGNGTIVPKFKIMRTSNPTSIRDKLFTEFAQPVDENSKITIQ